MIFKNKKNEETMTTEKNDKKFDEVMKKVGVCQRLGYSSGCNCLNECALIRTYLDQKYENTELSPRK